MRKKMLAAFAAAALAAAPALAEPWTKGYGGSGADRLTELVEYEGGLIAAGQTSSEDGDLETRTRSNQAGWMMRLNEVARRFGAAARRKTGETGCARCMRMKTGRFPRRCRAKASRASNG